MKLFPGAQRRSEQSQGKALALAALLLLVLLAVKAGERPRVTLLVKEVSAAGELTVQPVFTPWLRLERIAPAQGPVPTLARGEAMQCEAFSAVRGITTTKDEKVVVHELRFNCADEVYSVRAVLWPKGQ